MDTCHGRIGGRGGEIKVFWFFSSEKNILPYLFDIIRQMGFKMDASRSARGRESG
jgi:hypothetical protein